MDSVKIQDTTIFLNEYGGYSIKTLISLPKTKRSVIIGYNPSSSLYDEDNFDKGHV